MSDAATLSAYEARAAAYAAEWENEQDVPEDLYRLLQTYFRAGTVIDIGCGSGRDSAWLHDHGFAVHGYDASEALLIEARRHPGIAFDMASLPDLRELGSVRVANEVARFQGSKR